MLPWQDGNHLDMKLFHRIYKEKVACLSFFLVCTAAVWRSCITIFASQYMNVECLPSSLIFFLVLLKWYCVTIIMLFKWYCVTIIMLFKWYCVTIIMLFKWYCVTIVMLFKWYCVTIVMLFKWYCVTIVMLFKWYCVTIVMLFKWYCVTIVILLKWYCVMLWRTLVGEIRYRKALYWKDPYWH